MFTRLSALAVVLLSGTLLLTGCGVTDSAMPSAQPLAISGKVYGGAVPINGAHLYLYAANTLGYAGPGIAASTTNASISLLIASSGTMRDGNGNYYVKTGTTGAFSLSGDYTACTSGQQLYLYATGGDTGAGNNAAAGLMAVLGACGAVGSGTQLTLNEATTVAAAYALAGFTTDPLHIADDEAVTTNTTAALAKQGMANAFSNAGNLVNLQRGAPLTTTPGGSGTVPIATINTIASVIGDCVQTSAASSIPCTTFFQFTGTQNTLDTAYAAINLAHNPAGAPNTTVTPYFLWQQITPVAGYNPQLTAAPNDYTVPISYGNLPGYSNDVQVDANGSIWTFSLAPVYYYEFVELSGVGASYSSTVYALPQVKVPEQIAIDASGNVWVPDLPNYTIDELSGSGTMYTSSAHNYYQIGYPRGLAFDGLGNLWIGNATYNNVLQVNPSVAYNSVIYASSSFEPNRIAVDATNSIWVTESGNSNFVTDFYGSGVTYNYANFSDGNTAAYPSPAYVAVDSNGAVWDTNTANTVTKFTGTGISRSASRYTVSANPNYCGNYPLAIDGAGNVWVRSCYGLEEFNNAGVKLSPTTGFTSGFATVNGTKVDSGAGLAVDGSGNLWTSDVDGNQVLQIVGAATPVITPLVNGVIRNKVSTRP